MAETSSIVYCTDTDLRDIYPGISEFDLKKRIYNFDTETIDGNTVFVSYDSGYVSNMFVNSQSWYNNKQTIGTTASTKINMALNASASVTTLVVDNGAKLVDGSYIKIGSEILAITNIATHTLTVARAQLGTTAAQITDDSDVFQHFNPTKGAGSWLYDETLDFLIVENDSDPDNLNIEVGDDWSTIKTRYKKKASRMVESLLDNRLSREIMKDREGNYPEFIVRATALKAVVLLIRAHDPNNDIAAAFDEEFNMIIEGYRSGAIVLPTNSSGDSAQGILREVGTISGELRIAEIAGEYFGSGYDLLKVIVTQAGTIGTAKFSVYQKNGDSLKTDLIVDNEIIDGDYQGTANGLYIRWAGKTDASEAVLNDEYEIEVKGERARSNVISSIGSISMTRR